MKILFYSTLDLSPEVHQLYFEGLKRLKAEGVDMVVAGVTDNAKYLKLFDKHLDYCYQYPSNAVRKRLNSGLQALLSKEWDCLIITNGTFLFSSRYVYSVAELAKEGCLATFGPMGVVNSQYSLELVNQHSTIGFPVAISREVFDKFFVFYSIEQTVPGFSIKAGDSVNILMDTYLKQNNRIPKTIDEPKGRVRMWSDLAIRPEIDLELSAITRTGRPLAIKRFPKAECLTYVSDDLMDMLKADAMTCEIYSGTREDIAWFLSNKEIELLKQM